MKPGTVLSFALAALAGVTSHTYAAEQIISCPGSVQVGVTSNLPGGWQATPQVGGLQNTSVKTVGGQKMLVCNYRHGNSTTSVMKQPPAGSNCRSIRGGFSCSAAGTRASGGKTLSTDGQAQKDVPVVHKDKRVPLDTTQTQTKTGPGTVQSSSSGSCPDLAFTKAFVEQVSPARGGAYNVVIVAQLLNRGPVDYRSSPNQQQVSIVEEPAGGKPRQVAIEDIGGYRAGQLLANESGAIRYQLNNWRASDEFPPSYRFKLVFDPDIRQDGNPDNDDCNARNNEIVISGDAILKAIKRSAS